MHAIELWMMLAFSIALGLTFWKLYAFIPTKPLEDDDRTEEAVATLTALMECCIIELFEQGDDLNERNLYEQMRNHDGFDRERFWRFNQNRLNQLLYACYAEKKTRSLLKELYKQLRPLP